MTERDKKIRDLVIKVRGYYEGIDERLTDALKAILRRLDKPDHIPGVGKKVEESELTDADVISIYEAQCWPANENKIKEWKKWGKDMCDRLEAANKRAEKAEADNEAIGQHYEGLEQHYNRALQTGKQLTAKLAEANGVIEMLKEKGIG